MDRFVWPIRLRTDLAATLAGDLHCGLSQHGANCGSCGFGEPLGLCFAATFAQPCEPEARRCGDGSFAWVLPGPDNAVVLAYSASSCGVPDHFWPCPPSRVPDDLTADLEPPRTGADDLDAVVTEACRCACEDAP